MTNLIKIAAYLDRQNVKGKRSLRAGPAQLLLFTGVRYERMQDLPEPERGGVPPLSGTRRKRRRA